MILVCLISVIMVCHYYVFKENFLSFKNEVFSKGLRAFYVFELASDPNCILYDRNMFRSTQSRFSFALLMLSTLRGLTLN